MSAYSAPVPPVGEQPRPGYYDRGGVPQDVLPGEVLSSRTEPRRPAPAVPRRRSLGIAVLLAALLGPIGLSYSSLLGAGVTSAVLLMMALPVLPLYPPWVFAAWALTLPLCVVWATFSTLAHNARAAWLDRADR